MIACYILALPRHGAGDPPAARFDATCLGAASRQGPLAIHHATADPARQLRDALVLLSPAERTMMQAMREPVQRTARVFAHAALRLLLGERLACPPSELAFESGRFGKPVLRGVQAPHFSLSWRPGVAAIALCDSLPVGIDVEIPTGAATMEAAAAWLFSPRERKALVAAHGPQRSALFLETWTRKEAVCKAAGLPLDTMRGREPGEGPGDSDGADEGSAGGFLLHTAAEQDWTWSLAWPQPAPGTSAARRSCNRPMTTSG